MSSPITFAVEVTVGYGSGNDSIGSLNKACSNSSSSNGSNNSGSGGSSSLFGTNSTSWLFGGTQQKDVFFASASSIEMCVDREKATSFHRTTAAAATTTTTTSNYPSLTAIFVPPTMIDACLGKATAGIADRAPSGSCFWIKETNGSKLANDLLPRIHASLTNNNCRLRGIIVTSVASEHNAPAEIVLVDISQRRGHVSDLIHKTNGESMTENSNAIIKMIPISKICFRTEERSREQQIQQSTLSTSIASPISYALPTCPVCLHRIDPVRLGLPKPSNQHLCSKFCPAPSLIHGSLELDSKDLCPKQRFLIRWPPPSRCTACHVIHQYWNHSNNSHDEENDLFCAECAMHQTLWVCLTCGFVGCGRYSNKHSVAHFRETGHPYSLELATLRIWDYVDGDHGGYAHRADLLECCSSPPLAQPWVSRSRAGLPAASSHDTDVAHCKAESFDRYHNVAPPRDEKSPKKATMIGVEYEALLQSALEDQAQHYEGEISRLRADLTAALVDEGSMTIEEIREIQDLKADIARLRKDIDKAGRELLDAQAQEAGHRATSQRLLREQQVANDLLEKIQEDAKREHELGKMQVEDLEQQIADLTGNLKMRQQFSESEELNNAQIFGTKASESKSGKRGKKKGRFFRK